MSKYANAGELRTLVRFCRVERGTDAENMPTATEVEVCALKCKWVNAHGTETFTAMQLQLREPATITCRYTPQINRQLVVYKADDLVPYEVLSIDDVEDRHRWLEIKVQRKEAAR